MRTHVNFTSVNEIQAMYERPRVNVKVERRSTFTFTRDTSNIASSLFTRVKLRGSGNPSYGLAYYSNVLQPFGDLPNNPLISLHLIRLISLFTIEAFTLLYMSCAEGTTFLVTVNVRLFRGKNIYKLSLKRCSGVKGTSSVHI